MNFFILLAMSFTIVMPKYLYAGEVVEFNWRVTNYCRPLMGDLGKLIQFLEQANEIQAEGLTTSELRALPPEEFDLDLKIIRSLFKDNAIEDLVEQRLKQNNISMEVLPYALVHFEKWDKKKLEIDILVENPDFISFCIAMTKQLESWKSATVS